MNTYDLKKDKYICPNIEDMKVGDAYAFTLSPDHPLPVNRNYTLAMTTWLRKMRGFLEECDHFDTYLYYELSKTGRPHLHGYITVHDLVGFYSVDMPILQRLGAYCIRKIGNSDDPDEFIYSHNQWELYIKKQQALIAPCFKGVLNYPLHVDNKNKIKPLLLK